jgi:hypothetical protein
VSYESKFSPNRREKAATKKVLQDFASFCARQIVISSNDNFFAILSAVFDGRVGSTARKVFINAFRIIDIFFVLY